MPIEVTRIEEGRDAGKRGATMADKLSEYKDSLDS
jgi:hypothetical protein